MYVCHIDRSMCCFDRSNLTSDTVVSHVMCCLHSFWAETAAGEYCSRLTHNRKNIGFSIMSDYLRRAFVTKCRTLNPDIFDTEEEGATARYRDTYRSTPAYLSQEVDATSTETNIILPVETEEESALWDMFVQENGLDYESSDDDEEDVGARVFYSRCRLNGVEIRTVMMEEKKKTRDSVVCGRYTVNDENRDTFFFGEVRHIASWRGSLFFCVEWFKNRCVTHDQMSGLHTIPVSPGPQDQM